MKRRKILKETSIEQREVGREYGDSLRNWQLMFRVPEAPL